jgi:hypothetical protein
MFVLNNLPAVIVPFFAYNIKQITVFELYFNLC